MTKDEINKTLAEFMGCRTPDYDMDDGLYWHPIWDRQMTFNNLDDLLGPDGVWERMCLSQRFRLTEIIGVDLGKDGYCAPIRVINTIRNAERLAEAMAPAIRGG